MYINEEISVNTNVSVESFLSFIKHLYHLGIRHEGFIPF